MLPCFSPEVPADAAVTARSSSARAPGLGAILLLYDGQGSYPPAPINRAAAMEQRVSIQQWELQDRTARAVWRAAAGDKWSIRGAFPCGFAC